MRITRSALSVLSLCVATSTAFAGAGEISFTPTHLRVPIVELGLVNSAGKQVRLYTCDTSTNPTCEVDLTDEAAVQGLFAAGGTAIASGTYSKVYVQYCNDGTVGYKAKLEGSATLSGTKYYTHATEIMTTDATQASALEAPFQGCATSFPLLTPKTVADGETLTVQLISFNLLAASMKLDHRTAQGCISVSNATTKRSVCVAYPDLIPVVGDVDPGIVVYGIAPVRAGDVVGGPVHRDDENLVAAGVLLVYDRTTNTPLTGMTRPIKLSESATTLTPDHDAFVTAFAKLQQNADGSLYIENHGSTENGPGYVTLPNFVRGDHIGMGTIRSDTTQDEVLYQALDFGDPRDAHTPTLPVCPSVATELLVDAPVAAMAVTPLLPTAFTRPIGTLDPPDHVYPTPHMYFYVIDPMAPPPSGTDPMAEVIAPAELHVSQITIRHYDQSPGGGGAYEDFSLEFSVCQGVAGYFHHVRSFAVDSALDRVFAARTACRNIAGDPTRPLGETTCNLRVDVTVPAGSVLGYTGDAPHGVMGLDFGLRDYRLATGKSAFVNPARHCDGDSETNHNVTSRCYAVCPFDYLPAAKRTPYDALTNGDHLCGTVYRDVAGTAQGYWALFGPPSGGVHGPEAYTAYFGPSARKDAVATFSLGEGTPIAAGQYHFVPATTGVTNRAFAEIAVGTTAGAVYCWDKLYPSEESAIAAGTPLTTVLLAQSLGDGGFLLAPSTDADCSTIPTTMPIDAARYER